MVAAGKCGMRRAVPMRRRRRRSSSSTARVSRAKRAAKSSQKGGGRGSAIGLSVICDLRLCSRSSCAERERERDREGPLLPVIDVTCNAARLEIILFLALAIDMKLARRREGDSKIIPFFFKKKCMRGTQNALTSSRYRDLQPSTASTRNEVQ